MSNFRETFPGLNYIRITYLLLLLLYIDDYYFLSMVFAIMLKLLLSRFMKTASLSIITSSAQLLKLDLDKLECHVEYKKIDIGFNADTSLKELTDKKKVSDKAVLEF